MNAGHRLTLVGNDDLPMHLDTTKPLLRVLVKFVEGDRRHTATMHTPAPQVNPCPAYRTTISVNGHT